MSDVTQILSQIEAGDPSASKELLPLVYEELRRLAKARMAHERADHILQSTALVHEAYLRLVDNEQVQHWNSRGHFFAAAAEAMRRILVDSARSKNTIRRGAGRRQFEITDDLAQTIANSSDELIDLNEALDELAQDDFQAAELVKLRLFAGLSTADAAQILGISRTTAYEIWDFARIWFSSRMSRDG